MLAFLPIILFFYSHSLYLFNAIILNYANTYAYIHLKVVTIRIFVFLSGCILALLKAVCSLPKKEFDVNKRNLLMGTGLLYTWSNEIASL